MQTSDQDQRIRGSGMEDTSITIEFLRARLLAERSVSKSARQRAGELAERVAELEEQLRIVCLQRKKAEKATADVLAILETHGANDISDSFYSSSDQESTPRGQKGEGSINSCSDIQPSKTPGSLSWKGRKDPSRSIEKFKDSHITRRSSFLSSSSSSKQRMGKSCRQIKRREQKEARGADTSFKDDSQKDGDESETGVETSRVDTGRLEEFGAERNMERALRRQAQLIVQYEDMEKAQREWEEKYQENNSSTAESCDPGIHSDITDEREEVKSQSQHAHQRVITPCQDPQLEDKKPETCDVFSGTHIPDSVPTSLGDGKSPTRVREREQPPSLSIHDHMKQKSPPLASEWPRNQEIPEKTSAQGSETSSKKLALVPHQTPDQVGSLLDTLQRAKSLLQKELTQVSPIVVGGSVQAIEPSFREPGLANKVNIPGAFPGLFRLPTDFMPEATRGNFPFPSSSSNIGPRASFSGIFPERRASLSSDGLFTNGRSRESTNMSIPVDDRFLSNQFMNFASRTVPPIPRVEPHFNVTVPTSYVSYPQSPSYPDLAPRQPFNGGYFPRLEADMAFAVPPSDHHLVNSNVSGSSLMYR